MNLTYYCDDSRHLVCVPYSIENLHHMANNLNINKCWYHASKSHPHYDIPKCRVQEIMTKCIIIDSRMILDITKGINPMSSFKKS